MRERPIQSVPRAVIGLLLLGLLAQVGWRASSGGATAQPERLPLPPSGRTLRLAALGDETVLAKLLMLWLQAFDNQPGVSIPFRDLDYDRVVAWLDRILELDPRSAYPLLAASRVYAQVSDEKKQRRMLDFVSEKFQLAPNRRWRWMAQAALTAKHRLNDLPLALEYARAITERATGPEVPYWARDMTAIILEEMGELEAARILIGGLLAEGSITDPNEIRFLEQKLAELARRKPDEKSTHR